MEEDKESLCCTGVMDISSKPFKPINKGTAKRFFILFHKNPDSLLFTEI
jgi:hypothetical protein